MTTDSEFLEKVRLINQLRGLPSSFEGSENKDMFSGNPQRLVIDIMSSYCYSVYLMKKSGGTTTIQNYLSAKEMDMFLDGMIAALKLK